MTVGGMGFIPERLLMMMMMTAFIKPSPPPPPPLPSSRLPSSPHMRAGLGSRVLDPRFRNRHVSSLDTRESGSTAGHSGSLYFQGLFVSVVCVEV